MNKIIAAGVFDKNFGSFTKADYETLMFSIYLDNCDEKDINDYDLSLKLCVTESKVRNLRVKSQLLYPKELMWKEKFIESLKVGRFNELDNTITVAIEDPSVRNKIKHEFEREYGVLDITLSNKQIRMPIETCLLFALDMEENGEDVLKKLNEKWVSEDEKRTRVTRENLRGRAFKRTKDFMNFLIQTSGLWANAVSIVESFQKL